MDLVRKYLLVGLLWGIILGYGAVAIATGLGVTVLFLIVYGEGPWGEGTGTLLYGLAIAGFTAAVLICSTVGYLFGRRMQSLSLEASELAIEHRRAHILIATAIVAAFLGAYQLYAQHTALTVRQGYLEQMLDARQTVADVRATHRRDGRGIDIALITRGERAGMHALELLVRDSEDRLLERQRHELELPDREAYRVLTVDYADLIRAVVEREYRGQEPVVHRGTLSVIARLAPLLEPQELRTLPRHAATHYLAPDSPFYSERRFDYPIEFRFEEGRHWVVVEGERHPVAR
ncbi:hypothetical protein B1C78_06005 [Thioalkalivibrio denitrificans]|uniref:Uncharacterized protein n=1 Tax=Thioalkalivibrio denitrificans TaxID=108003 RepID=A0A1V3NLA7_9GAMM|nr:hypothetical protein [Thioalkalivibrio denitrificans]OOG25658.1 hypothetical protein B1C78_06005 [Thioalkalivibrio denitrificans]